MTLLRVGEYSLVVHPVALLLWCLAYARMADVTGRCSAADATSADPGVSGARCRVTKVRQFQKLALMSAGDGQLQQRLKQLLKLSKEKWDSACEHAKTAVQVRFF